MTEVDEIMQGFNPVVWRRYWRFTVKDFRLLLPIINRFSENGFIPCLAVDLETSREWFHRKKFEALKEGIKQSLPEGVTLENLYDLIEPAGWFHEIWLYRMFQRRDSKYPIALKHHTGYKCHISSICAEVSPFPAKVKATLQKEFDRLTCVCQRPWVDFNDSPKQYDVLLKFMGESGLSGDWHKNNKTKGNYIVHKAPYWGRALRVLNAYLKTRRLNGHRVNDYQASQIAYKFLHLVFPDVFEKPLTPRARWDFIRLRVRYSPKRFSSPS